MKKSYVKTKIGNELLYLVSLFPVKWSNFISSAKIFETEDNARECLNSRFSKISESLNHNTQCINNIMIDTYEDANLIQSCYYIGGISL